MQDQDIVVLLTSMRQKGVRLWLEGGQLCYHVEHGALTFDEIQSLRDVRQKIISILSGPSPICSQTASSLDSSPLSFQQLWLWGVIQTKSHWGSVPFTLRILGKLDVEILRKSIDELLRANAALRTRIVTIDGVPKQQVDDPHDFQLELTQAVSDENERHIINEFFTQKCCLAAGPLFRARLIRSRGDEHCLLIAVHHIVIDGWSIVIMFREIWSIYDQLTQGRSTSISKRGGRFTDYAIWQHESHSNWVNAHEQYWTSRLSGTDRIRLPVDSDLDGKSNNFGVIKLSLGVTLASALRKLARTVRVLLPIVVLAAHAALISRWCNQKDFVVPFHVSGRHPDYEDTIGYFAQLLLLRIELSGKETYVDVIKLVFSEFCSALTHQDFGQLATRHPDVLAGTHFLWQSWQPDELAGVPKTSIHSNIKIEPINPPMELDGPYTDISFFFFDEKEDIVGYVFYRENLFRKDTMVQFTEALRLSLAYCATTPHSLVAEIDLPGDFGAT